MKIWLDDIRDAPDNSWAVARTAREAFDLLDAHRGEVEVLSLDHDLGWSSQTGYDLLCSIEKIAAHSDDALDFVPKEMRVHSSNPVGRINMQRAIDSINKMREGDVTHFIDFLNGVE